MNPMELGLLEVDTQQTIVRVYDRCCTMLGYTEGELIGKNAIDLLVAPEFKAEQLLRESGVASSYELQLCRKDGSRIWTLVSDVPIFDEQGDVAGSIGIHYDLTERKELEEQLARAKQIAEEARMAEKQFLANMSHEIRTPLNAIIGMSHLLFDTQPSMQQREYIDILKTSADFLHSLISDLLDMTKIEAGRIEVHPRAFDLAGLLRATQKVFEMKLDGRSISVDVLLDTRIVGNVVGDDLMLNQILMNLVGNAEKFTEEGRIQIIAKVGREDEQGYWIDFEVNDTGIGIPDEKLDLVFQKFRQVNPHGHKHKGTGLGLAITKELVEIQGGTISVKSVVGRGSQFFFSLPFGKAVTTAETKPVAEKPVVPTGDMPLCRVLVAEDNVMNQKYIGSLLNKWMIPFALALDGTRAVEMAKSQPFDIILMDIQMPLMNGYEATVAIRSSQNPNQHVPIIALTASAMLDHKHTAIEAGMDDFLTKPFDPAQLLAILQHYAKAPRKERSIAPATPNLNKKRLTELYGDDHAYASDMFATFLSDVVPEINLIPRLCEEKNWPAIGRLAHKLKPAMGMVGLTRLEEELTLIEKNVNATARPDIIEMHCQNVMAGMDTMLPVIERELQKLTQA